MKLTINSDLDKYGYSGYGIGFDARSQFLLHDGNWSKDVIAFAVDNSFSVHGDNKKKYMLVLGEGPTQGLDDAKITAEAKYPINFTQPGKKLC